MARKASADSGSSHRGFNDIVGVALLAAALLLLVSQWSFNRDDIAFLRNGPKQPIHNWIGPFGAYFAWWFFSLFGLVAYFIPVLLASFGVAYLFGWLDYLVSRRLWSNLCAGALIVALTGLLHLTNSNAMMVNTRYAIGSVSVGGWSGYLSFEYIFWMLGAVGAIIAYSTIAVISLLILTNFQLGHWVRAAWQNRDADAAEGQDDEVALERKARDLQRQAKKLQDEVDKSGSEKAGSGLGADGLPVPEPTVRDLSVPQVKPGRGKKPAQPEPVKEIAPPDEGEVIPAREVAAASTSDILGKSTEAKADEKAAVTTDDKTAEPKPEPVVTIADGSAPPASPAPVKPKLQPKKPKPITVASTPMIGNYQLPSMDFLQHPDMTVKPTESKEELMANARLMQQTLAQFDIEVSLGDITKGPTITRYELHPAPGVKLEKIQGLNNNLAAALKAERINILAPVPGKSSVGIEVPNLIKTKVIMRDLLESDEWRNSKARIPLALGKDVYGHPIIADLAEMPHCLIAGSTGSGKSVCINSIIASLLYKFSPDQLRFVMIDPKVVELQQYNALPHLVVPVVTDPKKVILALRWVVNEMEKRYQIFAKVGVRNIASFNSRPKNKPLPQQEPELPLMAKKEKVEPGAEGFAVEVDEEIVVPREDDIIIPEKLSYIVVIIDELADLMLVAPADVEMAIARITQMARAAGIHCIVATQRPSVDVITGVIKANIPARIA
ncbi:MAG TPA: DNA translocase FtsK, partial [Candidatus Paceibacterota bacterium]|nr:DNA translocase FtsK [Candidatus Paceibacterota bacterium]